MHNGTKVMLDAYCGKWMTKIIKKLKGHHEPQEEKVFYEILKKIPNKSIMLELGAYWSYYSCWFHNEKKESKNYMIEPSQRCLEIGQINTKLNNFEGDFTLGFIGAQSANNCRFINSDGSEQFLNKICIDDFLVEKNIEHINILHSDIQGAEYDMLIGAERSIDKAKIDYLFISTHGEDIHKTCVSFLKDKHFNIIVNHTIEESYSVDGLIVASAPHIDGCQSYRNY